jgi:hypothetical protein
MMGARRPGRLQFDAKAFRRALVARIGVRTLRECSKECGVSEATLCRLANGSAPDLESFHRLRAWMGAPVPAVAVERDDA